MIEKIIHFSVNNKLIIAALVLTLIIAGIISMRQLPIDAVPDITNNQVQVVTVSSSLAPQEVEQFITYPIEVAMSNIPNVTEIRSISRYGLSVVTIVFKDKVPILEARQFVKEQISMATEEIPDGLGSPELMPITTGLGEIYQYVLKVEPGYEDRFGSMELRTIQDWIVKRQLSGTPGIIEISSFGGYLKQYEVSLDPLLLESMDISIAEVFDALSKNNQNSGGSYIEKNTNAFYIRTEGVIKSIQDIEQIVVGGQNGIPVLIKDIGEVVFGSPKRFGAMTMDGKGEAVGGITLMLKNANSSDALKNVHERIEEVKKSLPEGVSIYPYLDRSTLVSKSINTVKTNLLEGGLIVIFVLVLLLGNLRAGLIVASIIPLSLLFAMILMRYFGLSANLMSLGAIDFGIVVDGAVIIVEGVLHTLFTYHVGKKLAQKEMDSIIANASAKLFRSAVFGVFIILVVFIPIMTLTGIEGKMFRPMAMTFSFAILGALLLSLTYVPMITALVMPKTLKANKSFADKLVDFFRKLYKPTVKWALDNPFAVLAPSALVFIATLFLFRNLGAVFIPTLEEGDLAMQMAIQPGSSLQESVRTSTKAEKILLEHFPEVEHIVSKIGTAEVPTDPMAIEDGDIMIILKDKKEWTSAKTRDELVGKMKEKLEVVAGASFEFTQPIQLRFNELMTGAKTDIAIKIFGENTDQLVTLANKAAALVVDIPGAGDVKVEQTDGLPQLMIEFDRRKIAQYGLDIENLNTLVRTAYAGETAGVVFENERKFDLVVRLNTASREDLNLSSLFVHLPDGSSIPFSEVAQAKYTEGPMMISREDARRRINIGVNVRNRDVASLVADIKNILDEKLLMPPGYTIKYGGQFENLEKAQKRLAVAVPVALLLIFVLLFFTFERLKYALIILTAVPLSAIGGVIALWVRGMPFSISAGVGFIALFGVAVLNGIVLISYFNQLRYEKDMTDIREVVIQGGLVRMRPVVMTAMVAALGFIPMALSTSNGAEVQKPLATVVIGGLITATMLTLLVLPVLYYMVNKKLDRPKIKPAVGVIAMLLLGSTLIAQQPLTLNDLLSHALENHPELKNAALKVQGEQQGIGAAKMMPPTLFGLESGQINSKQVDYKFSVEQNLGNPAERRELKSLSQASTLFSEKEYIRKKLEIETQIKQHWFEWVFLKSQSDLLQQHLVLAKNFFDKSVLMYESGESGQLEKAMAETNFLQADNTFSSVQMEAETALARLKEVSFYTEEFNVQEIELSPLPMVVSPQTGNSALAPFAQKVEVAKNQSALHQTSFKPTFSLAYANQSIRPDFSFQSVQAVMAVPLWRKSMKAKSQQFQIQEIIAANELSLQQHYLEREFILANQQAAQLKKQLDTNGLKLKETAALLRELTDTQFSHGEIDFFRYLQSFELALKNELEYLQLLNQYNQAVLRLEFLIK